jgi:hypothetical protein
LGLAVVMPRVDRSFYLNEAHGNKYWTFLSEELPEVVRGSFRISTRREDTFVAGFVDGWLRRDEVGAQRAAPVRSGGQSLGPSSTWPNRPPPTTGAALTSLTRSSEINQSRTPPTI